MSFAVEAADTIGVAIVARPTVVNARFCKPLDVTLLRQLADQHELVVTVDDHAELAGFGSAVIEELQDRPARILTLGLPDRFVDHGKRELLLVEVGLTADSVAARPLRALRQPASRIATVSR